MRLRLSRYAPKLPRWPKGARLRLLMVADLHACWPWMGPRRVDQVVDQANAVGADAIALMGDYAGHPWGSLRCNPTRVCASLARLRAPLGTWAILGNHDWKDDAEAQATRSTRCLWHDALDAAGVATLHNRAVPLDVGASITLAGVDSQRPFKRAFRPMGPSRADLPAALAGTDPDRFTLLLAHEPDLFPDTPPQVDLMLSGHMHGGQIAPFGRPLVAPSRYGTRYAYGLHRQGAQALVVSGGIGYSGPPVRIGCPPELTLVELS